MISNVMLCCFRIWVAVRAVKHPHVDEQQTETAVAIAVTARAAGVEIQMTTRWRRGLKTINPIPFMFKTIMWAARLNLGSQGLRPQRDYFR